MPVYLKQCCWYFGLRTGSLLIGYFCLFFQSALIIIYFSTLVDVVNNTHTVYTYESDKKNYYMVILLISMFISASNIPIAILLLFGIYKKKIRWLCIWCKITCGAIIFVIFFLMFGFHLYSIISTDFPAAIGPLMMDIFLNVYNMYALYVVKSYLATFQRTLDLSLDYPRPLPRSTT